MKKKIIALALSTTVLGMGTGVYAASNFYEELESKVRQEIGMIDSRVSATYTVEVEKFKEEEKKRAEREVMTYLESKQQDIIDRFKGDAVEKEKERIRKETDRKIAEIKKYIDSVAGENE